MNALESLKNVSIGAGGIAAIEAVRFADVALTIQHVLQIIIFVITIYTLLKKQKKK